MDKAPEGFSSPFIIRFDTDILPGINSMPVNVTNSRALAAMISDNTDNWKGWGIIIETNSQQNPQTKKMTTGLVVVEAVKPDVVAKTRKNKPTIKDEPASTEPGATKRKGGLPF